MLILGEKRKEKKKNISSRHFVGMEQVCNFAFEAVIKTDEILGQDQTT